MGKITGKKNKKVNCIYFICWLVIPIAILMALVLDGLGLYIFNRERLIVIGACIIVLLIPFFKEITIKNISLKQKNDTQ